MAEGRVVGGETERIGVEMKLENRAVGDEAEQMGDRSNHVGDIALLTTELGDDLIERILLRLPLHSCIRFASLNKRLYSSISSPAFFNSSIAGTRPFFYLWGLDPVTHQTLSCMYDPLADRWFPLNLVNNMRPLSSPFHSYSLTSTPSGTIILYLTSVPSPDNVLLRFAPNPTNTDWKISSAAIKRFDTFPIIAAFDSGSTSSSSSFEVFVLGELSNGLTIQLYNSATESWEVCDAQLPSRGGFYQFMGSCHVSSAVVGRKVYLANIALGTITCFSMESKSWKMPSRLQAPNARCFLISSTKRGLYALGLCAITEAEECVKLFEVNELTMECKEVSKMPHRLWSLLADQFEPGTNSVFVFSYARCVGSESLVYVYSGSYFNKIRICVCDIDDGYRWRELPLLPDTLRCLELRANSCSFLLQPKFRLK